MTTPIIEDFSPVYTGNCLIPFAPQFRHKNGRAFDLSGATLSMVMRKIDAPEAGTVKTCSGPWVIQDATGGLANYTYQPADVDTPGEWELWPMATVGGKSANADPKVLKILARPS